VLYSAPVSRNASILSLYSQCLLSPLPIYEKTSSFGSFFVKISRLPVHSSGTLRTSGSAPPIFPAASWHRGPLDHSFPPLPFCLPFRAFPLSSNALSFPVFPLQFPSPGTFDPRHRSATRFLVVTNQLFMSPSARLFTALSSSTPSSPSLTSWRISPSHLSFLFSPSHRSRFYSFLGYFSIERLTTFSRQQSISRFPSPRF